MLISMALLPPQTGEILGQRLATRNSESGVGSSAARPANQPMQTLEEAQDPLKPGAYQTSSGYTALFHGTYRPIPNTTECYYMNS